ncbi:MAG: DUF2079 domain-containing protein [Solirubrobacteraceae bacterium]
MRAPWRVFTITFAPVQKPHTMLALLAPFLFLSLSSRVFILALPLLAERFLSTKSSFWGTSFHYSMTIAPVLAMGAAGWRTWRLFPERRAPHSGVGCYGQWVRRSPDASPCFAAAEGPFQARQDTLSRAVHATPPQLAGGCRELAHAELIDTYLLTRALDE